MEDHTLHANLANHGNTFLSDTQWLVILGFVIILLAIYLLLRIILKKFATVDLLDHFHLRAFLKSSWYPLVFQIPTLLFLFS